MEIKSQENILIDDISYKTLIDPKQMDFLEFMTEPDI